MSIAVAKAPSTVQTIVTFLNSQGEPARGTLLKIGRSTVVLEVYNPYSIVQLSEVLRDLTIRRGDRKIYEGRGVVNNLVNTGLMLIVSVTLVDAWKDLAGVHGSLAELRQEAERFISDWSASHKIRAGYQLVVGEFQSLFSDLSRWLEQLDIVKNGPEKGREGNLTDEYFSELLEPINKEAGRLLQAFEEEASSVLQNEVPQHRAYVQKCVHPLIMRAPFPFRAFYKPLGYAGDYEMVNMMLRNPREGPSTYAELVNSIYLGTGPAQAHRNRIDMLIDLLTEAATTARTKNRPLRVLNVGCGPAIELQRFLATRQVDANTYFNLVDFNQETLDYAKAQLTAALANTRERPMMNYTHMSVHSLLKSASRDASGDRGNAYDLVYCAGLFDYLSDRVCSRLLRLFYQWADPHGGVVVATNVTPRNNALYLMEHILEWFLIYRDQNDMAALAKGLERKRVYADGTGINAFVKIQRIT